MHPVCGHDSPSFGNHLPSCLWPPCPWGWCIYYPGFRGRPGPVEDAAARTAPLRPSAPSPEGGCPAPLVWRQEREAHTLPELKGQ